MSLKVCVIIESNSQKICFAIVLYTNMAAVTLRENGELCSTLLSINILKAKTISLYPHTNLISSRPEFLEVSLALTSVNYHRNLSFDTAKPIFSANQASSNWPQDDKG